MCHGLRLVFDSTLPSPSLASVDNSLFLPPPSHPATRHRPNETMSGSLEKNLFQLKLTSKQLQRQIKKTEQEEKKQKDKLKEAIQKGNMEGARILGADAIRKKNEVLNLQRLVSRIDAVASRVQTAVTMRRVTSSMANVVKGMDRAMESMNLEKISMVMDKFEQQFEDLDVQTEYMEGAIAGTTTLTTPQNEVDDLIRQVAEESQIELKHELGELQPGSASLVVKEEKEKKAEDDILSERLRQLRQ